MPVLRSVNWKGTISVVKTPILEKVTPTVMRRLKDRRVLGRDSEKKENPYSGDTSQPAFVYSERNAGGQKSKFCWKCSPGDGP